VSFSETIHNEHFCNLAAVIRVALGTPAWREQHPEVQFWSLWNDASDALNETMFAQDRAAFVGRFSVMLSALADADPRLGYSETDLAWFVGAMDADDARVTASLLLAMAAAPDRTVTPAEAAEMTGFSESHWRNQAAAGDVPGAVKKGKQWLLPATVVKSRTK